MPNPLSRERSRSSSTEGWPSGYGNGLLSRGYNSPVGSIPTPSAMERWLEWFKAPVLKAGGRESRGFESHPFRS